ncbi:Protein CPL1-like domain-containing protein [Pleurotus pulmonarius]
MPTLTVTILVVTAALVCMQAANAQCNPGQFTDSTSGLCADCGPGTFNPNGAGNACSPCAAGSFNNVNAAVGCCSCCSGFYQGATGSTSCDSCGGTNSPVGSTSVSACGTGTETAVTTCSQDGSSRLCPATFAGSPTNNVRRRRSVGWSEADGCTKGQRRCNGKCTDVSSNLWHCGACAGTMTDQGTVGQDCAEIPHASDVRCEKKRCVVESCTRGRVPSAGKRRCVKRSSILNGFRQQISDF